MEMTASIIDGPLFVYGNLGNIPSAATGSPVPDPNTDAGTTGLFKGSALFDQRFCFLKDTVPGWAGRVPLHFMEPVLRSVGAIPATLGTANIAAAANVHNGTAMTLVAT